MLHVAAAAATAAAGPFLLHQCLHLKLKLRQLKLQQMRCCEAFLKFNLAGVVVACNFVAATDAISS